MNGRKMAMRKIKDQQIPVLFSAQLAHPLCIRVQRWLSGGGGSSAQTLWVCSQSSGAQMPPYPSPTFIKPQVPSACICTIHLLALLYWRSSYSVILETFLHNHIASLSRRSAFDEELLCGLLKNNKPPKPLWYIWVVTLVLTMRSLVVISMFPCIYNHE